jgi:hypothetical protein
MSASEQLGVSLNINFAEMTKEARAFSRSLTTLDRNMKKVTASAAGLPQGGLLGLPGPVAAGASSASRTSGSGRSRAKQTPSQRLMSALMGTRLNIGHASPSIGQSLKALGIGGAEAAPALLAIGAVVTVATAFYKLSEQASELANTFGRFNDATGSSGAGAAQLMALGSAGGIDTASIAQSIQDRITSDPAGMAAGLRLGVHNLPGPYGNQDFGQQELQVIAALRKITNVVDRLRLARAVGAEGLLPLTRLSDAQFAKSQADANVRSSIMTPGFLQGSADFQASLSRVGEAFKNLIAAVGQGEMQRLTGFLNNIADALNNLASWMSAHKSFIDLMTQIAEATISPTASALISASQHNDLSHAIADNTRATRDNTAILGKPGFYGRATRGSAIPSGFNGMSLAQSRDIAVLQGSSF